MVRHIGGFQTVLLDGLGLQQNHNNMSINRLNLLIESLENLSKSYQEQKKMFPDYVDFFDAVIGEFMDSFNLLPSIMEEDRISYESVIEILRCFNLIDLTFRTSDNLSDENFRNDSNWQLVRKYAGRALRQIRNDTF
jgi:hypothetical protein